MHATVLQLTPILGAEKSKVPFYIAGGLLVAWALLVSVVIGMRKPDFPSTKAAQRGIIAVTAVLVVAAASTAVITSGGDTTTASTTTSAAAPAAPSPAPSGSSTSATASGGTTATPSGSSPASATPSAHPTATTGSPAPPSSPAVKPPTTTTLKLAANPEGQLSYNTKQLSAKAGPVTITMTNMSPLPHNVTVAQGSTVVGATPTFQGGSRSLLLRLKPGTYTFYCSVPGHRQAGMEGTLTVSS
jgi:plastocyanin